MTDRVYRAFLGFLLLLTLTLDQYVLMYFIIVMLFFEGITNLRLPKLVCRFRNCISSQANPVEYVPEPYNQTNRFDIESERVWRLVVGALLAVTFYYYQQLWFFPWFMGFAIFGAGISGVCPVLLAIRLVGFK